MFFFPKTWSIWAIQENQGLPPRKSELQVYSATFIERQPNTERKFSGPPMWIAPLQLLCLLTHAGQVGRSLHPRQTVKLYSKWNIRSTSTVTEQLSYRHLPGLKQASIHNVNRISARRNILTHPGFFNYALPADERNSHCWKLNPSWGKEVTTCEGLKCSMKICPNLKLQPPLNCGRKSVQWLWSCSIQAGR